MSFIDDMKIGKNLIGGIATVLPARVTDPPVTLPDRKWRNGQKGVIS